MSTSSKGGYHVLERSRTLAATVSVPRNHKNLQFTVQTCAIWKNEEAPDRLLSIESRAQVVADFAEMNSSGEVSICGGEALLQSERVFALTRQCNTLGLSSQMASNSSTIDEPLAEQLAAEGPSKLVLSLNSHLPKVHDHTRGRIGSFDEVCRSLRLLRQARDRIARPMRLHIHAIICEKNYRGLVAFHDFVLNELQADRLDLGFLQPTFDPFKSAKKDVFFERNIIRNENEICDLLVECDHRFGLRLNPAWIEQTRMYHRSIRESGEAAQGWSGKAGTSEHICATYEKNIMVDPQGVARLCFSPMFRGMKLRRKGDLARFWRNAEDIRRKMKNCTNFCGHSDTVTRTSTRLPLVELGQKAA